jgi:hypothetical protein
MDVFWTDVVGKFEPKVLVWWCVRGTVKDQAVDANVYTGDGLRPKILRGNRFYKGHRDIAGKASHHFKKVSISLKMYLKNLANP